MQTLIFSDILQPGYGKNAGAYRIATELRENGFTCQVVDFFTHFTLQEIYQIIDKFVDKDTLWVGISTTFLFPFSRESGDTHFAKKWFGIGGVDPVTDYNSAFPFAAKVIKDIFKYIKSKNSNTKILVGGARSWAAQNHDTIMNQIYADFYVHGFADTSIVILTKWIQDKSNPSPKFSGWFNNVIDSNADYDYEYFNKSKIKLQKNDIIAPNEFIPIEIARGCIFKCKFCGFALLGKKRGDYTKSKEILQEEFIYNYENFGTTNYMFMDETINDSMEKVEFLHDVITNLPFKIKWGAFARLDLYYSNPEMAAIIQETGHSHTQFGIETFNKKSGEAIGKGMHPDKVKDTLQKLKSQWKSNVRMTSGFIVGLPHETKENIKELEDFLASDQNALWAWNTYPLILFDGSANIFGQNPSKYGYTFDPEKTSGSWKNDHMNFEEALELADNIRTKTMDKCKIYNWNHMRLQNLGYTEAEVDAMTLKSYTENMDDVYGRLKIAKDNYFKSLMK